MWSKYAAVKVSVEDELNTIDARNESFIPCE